MYVKYNCNKGDFLIDNRFCVYEHIRLDTNKCFYVGKGTKKRAYSMIRNEHHNRIVKKYGAKVKIIKDNLSEEEAYKLEESIIKNYVFNLGYGIDIIGYNNNENENGHLTNCSFGGRGSTSGMVHTEEWKVEHSKKMSGKNNPMYGINVWNILSDEKKEELREKQRNNSTGKNNSMYGISPRERMDEKTYERWLYKKRLNSIGENNPNYRNDTLHKKLLENPELKKEYYSRPGKQNGRAIGIELYDLDFNFIKDFDCVSFCAKWIKENYNIDTRITTMITSIKNATLNNKPYKKMFRFKYK